MTDSKNAAKPEKKVKSIEDEISMLQEKLRKVQELKKERDRKERERNQKAVLALIQAERLDTVPAEHWQAKIDAIKKLLVGDAQKEQGGKNVSYGNRQAPVQGS